MSHVANMSAQLPERIGDFVVLGLLGEGGSGIVYDARWGHREVALKVLHPALVATPKEREQFLVEARLLAELHHPAVVKVLAVGEAPDGRPFLAMEKLDGESLARRLSRGPVPVSHALELFGQLADAVGALHGEGLVHRDLKPENVMLVTGADGREHAVLLDFGIAKELAAGASTTTQEGKVRGTPAYMAPERFFGQPASVATDVYELAVTLFAMLAGRLPWDDVADPEVRLDPRRLSALAPHVPAGLDVELRRALSTRAQNRPAGATELRAAVMAAAGSEWAPRATVDVRRQALPHADTVPVAPGVVAPGTETGVTPRRGRVALWLALGVVAVSGIGVAAHFLSKPGQKLEAEAEPVAKAEPPPAPAPQPAAEPVPDLTEAPPRTIPRAAFTSPSVAPTAPKEQSAALAHLADDVSYVAGAQIAALAADTELSGLLDLLEGSTSLRLLRAQAGLDGCSLDIRGRATWVILGGPPVEGDLDLIVSGRWTRAELDACLRDAYGGGTLESGDKVSIIRGKKGERVIGWIDDHTAMLSSRDAADAAWMAARIDDVTAPDGELGVYLAETNLGGALWMAGAAAGQRLGLSENADMTAMWGAVTPDPDAVTLEAWVRYKTKDAAATAEAEMEAEASQLGLGGLGHVQIDRDAKRPEVLHANVRLARMIVGAIFKALAEDPASLGIGTP